MTKEKLNPSEALFGFAAWLSGRKERTVFSSNDECAGPADLVQQFIDTNNLEEVRDDQYPQNLIMPNTHRRETKPPVVCKTCDYNSDMDEAALQKRRLIIPNIGYLCANCQFEVIDKGIFNGDPLPPPLGRGGP
jgi:hypothetical protein